MTGTSQKTRFLVRILKSNGVGILSQTKTIVVTNTDAILYQPEYREYKIPTHEVLEKIKAASEKKCLLPIHDNKRAIFAKMAADIQQILDESPHYGTLDKLWNGVWLLYQAWVKSRTHLAFI